MVQLPRQATGEYAPPLKILTLQAEARESVIVFEVIHGVGVSDGEGVQLLVVLNVDRLKVSEHRARSRQTGKQNKTQSPTRVHEKKRDKKNPTFFDTFLLKVRMRNEPERREIFRTFFFCKKWLAIENTCVRCFWYTLLSWTPKKKWRVIFFFFTIIPTYRNTKNGRYRKRTWARKKKTRRTNISPKIAVVTPRLISSQLACWQFSARARKDRS